MIKTTMQGIKGNQKENRVEILTDTSSTGRVRPWREYKMANELLAMVYDSINPKKAGRLRDCADWLGFRIDEEGRKKLVEANFCHVRLCPMCQWRRSIKSYKYTSRIVSSMIAH
jgi:plasmid rolling circle replication initiator protein Rep